MVIITSRSGVRSRGRLARVTDTPRTDAFVLPSAPPLHGCQPSGIIRRDMAATASKRQPKEGDQLCLDRSSTKTNARAAASV